MDKIRVGCAVIAVQGRRIVLGRRGKEPMYGKWIIPGGGVGLFERYRDTAIREFFEETGLTIDVKEVVHVAEIIVPEAEHRIVIYVSAEVTGGTPRAGSDLLELNAFTRDEVAALARESALTPTVSDVLRQLGWLKGEAAGSTPFRMPKAAGARRFTSTGRASFHWKQSRRRGFNDESQLEFHLS